MYIFSEDYHIFIETATKVIKSSDGKNYLSFKNFIVNGDLKGELIADLKNLFNGQNKELGKKKNIIITNNNKKVYNIKLINSSF